MAANLSNHSAGLNRGAHTLILMTDERSADWAGAAARLPRGSWVIVRARTDAKRAALAATLEGIAPLLIADDPALAHRIGAAGLHLPQARLKEALHWRCRHPNWIITAAAHSLRAVMAARGTDALLLSPVFPTTSHPGAGALTPVRAAFIAAAARVPVYALGGVMAKNAGRLAPIFRGIAAISALLPPSHSAV